MPVKQQEVQKVIGEAGGTFATLTKGIKDARVSFHQKEGKWAMWKGDVGGNDYQTFDMAVMTNVKFTHKKTEERRGCSHYTYSIGFVEGTLYINQAGSPSSAIGRKNLSFDGENFLGEDGSVVKEAKALFLMPDRRSLYSNR